MQPMRTGVDHDENFPVASWLCPAAQRPAVIALYRFARTADDIADEGAASASERLRQLARYRQWLSWATGGCPTPPGEPGPGEPADPAPWPPLFAQLRQHITATGWPAQPFFDLLDAFEQDIHHTASGHRVQHLDELLDYARRSANPIGRLMLHLFGISDARSLRQSDAICTALQLINFWQDLRIDWPRQRHYLPQQLLDAHRLSLSDFNPAAPATEPERIARQERLIASLFADALARISQGAELAWRLPGRFGWELRGVVWGGIRVAEHAARLRYRTWLTRPRVSAADLPLLLWRSLRPWRPPVLPAAQP